MKRYIARHVLTAQLGALALLTLCFVQPPFAAGQAYTKGPGEHIDILSFSWGFVPGQSARVSVVHLGDASVRTIAHRIQILDTEGEVIAQSDEIRIEPGQIRFWDVSRDKIQAVGDPGTGRIQVRTRVLVTTTSFDVNRNRPPLAATLEVIESGTGRTVSYIRYNPFITVDY